MEAVSLRSIQDILFGVGEDSLAVFDLDLEAVRLLHRSVSFYLEKWPGGADPREQEALQSMKTLLTAALLEFSLDQDGQR